MNRAHSNCAAAVALMLLSSTALAQTAVAPGSPAPFPAPSPGYVMPASPAQAPGWGGDAEPTPDRSSRPARGRDDPALSPAERVALHPYLGVIGARTMMLASEGYDLFSSNDSFAAFTLGFGRSVYAEGQFTFAVMAFWDAGGRSSNLRGEPTEMFVHRLSLGPELRFHPLQDGYLFGRVSPALLNTVATLDESSTGAEHVARSDDIDLGFLSSWDFGVDVTIGLAYELFGSAGHRAGPMRFWLYGEGGYGWASSTPLAWKPEAEDSAAPQRVAVLDQGELAVRGGLFRVAVATTF
jgi:hypothetical protein